MKNNQLLKTNLYISLILMIGFILTAIFSYRANYRASLDNMEQVSSLTAEGIYYELTTMFTKPVNVSLTMAHDSLLVSHLMEETLDFEDESYAQVTRDYLEAYQQKYQFDAVFLVSEASGRYYNFNGIDRILTEDNPENEWYYSLMASDLEYQLVVDNDEVEGADNEITVFVNCKVYDDNGTVPGVVGVGIRIEHLKELLQSYEEQYNVNASLISDDGSIEISTVYTGYDKTDWFETYHQESLEEKILGWKNANVNLELWTEAGIVNNEKHYIVTRYIPELSWHLIVEQNTGALLKEIQMQIYQSGIVLAIVVVTVLIVVTNVIKRFNKQITELVNEREKVFHRATEEMYEAIYELNITKNCAAGQRTMEYFESLGAKGLPYDQSLHVIAEKQIKEEFREDYVNMFLPQNVIREYELGNNNLSYQFMLSENGTDYLWMQINAYIFFSQEDKCIHMFTYRKNIDAEKQKEKQALTDEMTGLYNKKSTEREISRILSENPEKEYAFFILDIDNFKQANDRFGHAFGDYCIQSFASMIQNEFKKPEVIGRIGGDEFAVFIAVENKENVVVKAQAVSKALFTVCSDGVSSWNMAASIGVAVAPADGDNFETLYKNADAALYHTKKNGKNGFTIYSV